MLAKRIKGANISFGKPKDWNDKHGECGALPVRLSPDPRTAALTGSVNFCESSWEPTSEELAVLAAGGSIILRVYGMQPAVALYVEPADEPLFVSGVMGGEDGLG